MSKSSKIIITIIAVIVFIVLFAVIGATREAAGRTTPRILGLIVFAGLIGTLRSVWKNPIMKNPIFIIS